MFSKMITVPAEGSSDGVTALRSDPRFFVGQCEKGLARIMVLGRAET